MKEKQEAEYKRLVMKAKDTGIKYGIYSKQYAKAIHAMNDYWKANKYETEPVKEKTFKEMIIEKRNKFITKWIHRNS